MCGIAGFIGNKLEPGILLELMDEVEVRGGHATGFSIARRNVDDTNTEFIIEKKAETFHKFFKNSQEAIPLLTESPETVVQAIGHTRYGTLGANTDKNAHPYKFGNVIGIHNGILRNHYAFSRVFGVPIEVDSEAIFLGVSNMGLGALSLVEGSFAVAIQLVNEPDSLYLYRHQNPIVCGIEGGNFYFASTGLTLYKHIPTQVRSIIEDQLVKVSRVGEALKIETLPLPSVDEALTREIKDLSYNGFAARETYSTRIPKALPPKTVTPALDKSINLQKEVSKLRELAPFTVEDVFESLSNSISPEDFYKTINNLVELLDDSLELLDQSCELNMELEDILTSMVRGKSPKKEALVSVIKGINELKLDVKNKAEVTI